MTNKWEWKVRNDRPVIDQLYALVKKHPGVWFWKSFY
jgi:hypothetical protein